MKTFYDYDIEHPFDVVGEKQTIHGNKIRLDYIPQIGTVSIEGFTESESTDVSGNKFFIDYSVTSRYRMATGFVTFDDGHDGEEVTIDYKGVSTLVLAKHMNEIKAFMEGFRNEVDERIQKVIGTTPDTLDTLQGIAEALGNDPNFSTTIMDTLKTKLDKAGGEIEKDLTVKGNMKVDGKITGNIDGTAFKSLIANKLSDGGTSKGMLFSYIEKNESPKKLWGTTDGENMFVYSPSLLNVNYAESAGAVSWANVSGKPAEYNPAPHTHSEYAPIDGNTLYTSNWFRSKGNTGWYSETHKGGIYMDDDDYVKIFGDKGFYCPGSVVTDSILTVGSTDAEGGEIHLNASTNKPAENGIVLDQCGNLFRIFGIQSADGKTRMGAGTPLVIDPYGKTISGGYTFTGNVIGNVTGNVSGSSGSCTGNATTASSAPWSGITGKPTSLEGYGITNAPTKTGGGASGTWGINISGSSGSCSGNAATASTAALLGKGGAASGGMKFFWKGQGGQPTWLWGGNDPGTDMYVYNPSNFSVNYAKSAGSAGSCTGNAASATKATNDSSNRNIVNTYLAKAGDVMTGNIFMRMTGVANKATKPSATHYQSIPFCSNDGNGIANRLGLLECSVDANGQTAMSLSAYTFASGSKAAGGIRVLNNNGTVTATAPTPATKDNSTQIATTAFVRAVVPTLKSGDSSKCCGFTLGCNVPANAKFTDTNTTYSAFTAATATAAGKAGLVPGAAKGEQGFLLQGNADWVNPSGLSVKHAKSADSATTATTANNIPTAAGKGNIWIA